jgi:hypothetical protein
VKCVNKDTPAANTTNTIELPKAGAMGSILLFISIDNESYARQSEKWRIIDNIDLIEVKGNGTTTLKSYHGTVARAMAWYDQKVFTPDVCREYGANTQFARVLINFGQKLYDRRRGINNGLWDSLELKIKNSLSTTQFTSSKLAYTAYAICKRGDGPFDLGHFRTETYKEWTTIATSWQYCDLPTDGLLRRIVLQLVANTSNGVDATNPTNYATEIKYFLKGRETELFDIAASEMQCLNLLDNEAEILSHITHQYHDDEYGLRSGVGYPLAWAGISVGKDGAGPTLAPTIGDETNSTVKVRNYYADYPWSMLVKGMGPESTIIFRHDRHPDLSDMLNLAAEGIKPATFDVYTKNASGTNRIVTDRLFKTEGKGA